MGGEMIVVVRCRGEDAGNMRMRRTRRSTHNNRRALVNVHDDTHQCCLGKGKTSLTLGCPIECSPPDIPRKCRGEEAGNMLPRRTRRSTHDYLRDLVNVHGDSHSCQLVNGKARRTFDLPIEFRVFRLKEVWCCAGKPELSQ